MKSCSTKSRFAIIAAVFAAPRASSAKPAPNPRDTASPRGIASGAEWSADYPRFNLLLHRAGLQLNSFLTDPTNKVGRIAAREDLRKHLIGNIGRHQCDVNYSLERLRSPYSLVLTKTNGSFDRTVKRFEADLRLLSELPSSD